MKSVKQKHLYNIITWFTENSLMTTPMFSNFQDRKTELLF